MKCHEIWTAIPEYLGYEISTLGRVRSLDRKVRAKGGATAKRAGRILSPVVKHRSGTSYLQISLVPIGGERKDLLVHRLVLTTFSRAPMAREQTRHLNGDSHDNRLINLQWGSSQENHDDMTRHGATLRGEKHPKATITDAKAKKIKELISKNIFTKTEIARRMKVPAGIVYAIAYGTSWGHI